MSSYSFSEQNLTIYEKHTMFPLPVFGLNASGVFFHFCVPWLEP